ncbi:hypothetical protein APY04_0457 [Hyphomicrobium sulfonivorans]|uniref:Uncharacterized protein n=1 Tax=Hyphomicrobium sulfonivorans TaxID=121290 RepID=A0A120CXV3_HYPSL|nr:hypothetical protein APY04_0457 [Hyphomicrobium sulfonivorans]
MRSQDIIFHRRPTRGFPGARMNAHGLRPRKCSGTKKAPRGLGYRISGEVRGALQEDESTADGSCAEGLEESSVHAAGAPMAAGEHPLRWLPYGTQTRQLQETVGDGDDVTRGLKLLHGPC